MDSKWQTISQLDLDSVRAKFAIKKGLWWGVRKSARQIEGEYRQFLYLIATHPGQTVVPWSRDLDDFWHQHILDTARYAADCNTVMGGFIHHNPNLPQGSPAHSKSFAETRTMYLAAFKDQIKTRKSVRSSVAGCGGDIPSVFVDSSSLHGHSHDGGHGGGHHGCGGHGGAGHGCGGHGCGGHGH